MTISIRETVLETLKDLSERTRSQVVEHFAKQESDKQAASIIKGLDALSQQEKTLSKIRPAFLAYNEEGEGLGEPCFSKEQVEERKKINDFIIKMSKAITKADEKSDFGDLYTLTSK